MEMNQLNAETRHCADTCSECAKKCQDTIARCLQAGGPHAEKDHIALLQVCADICQISARALMLVSSFHQSTCRACAEVCEACARECDSMEGDWMKECAEACRKCAEECWHMSLADESISGMAA